MHWSRTKQRIPFALLLCFAAFATPQSGVAAVLIDCVDASSLIADYIDRGFYIPAFPGSALDEVDLFFSATTAGDYTILLTARADTYDGTVIGTSQITVTLTSDMHTLVEGNFAFPSPFVTENSTVTFAMSLVSGPELPYFAVNTIVDPCVIVETNGTSPPLDTFRRQGIQARIHGQESTPIHEATWGRVKTDYR